ncbi:3'(2'),5'-bisphosphate nucleotidase CysQ [Thermopetrobacter sp. TC1]|uniref:3'(2'),5'-bisphosphate nucleotidase CysQ n=1 Tax=Thermopetrobacter sp. TC1 TaxID=1495045 RepID=UPI001E5F86FF|nr:3'(2'),5'-bisphosphate nucleotidase CysQ [Thermopetrobacter sp. TC1]
MTHEPSSMSGASQAMPEELVKLGRLAHAAGREIMRHYGQAAVRTKADDSPVTAADEAGEAIILKGLEEFWPDVPVVAEEMVAAQGRPTFSGDVFFLVDPLDGTREFIAKRDEFTVNIARIEGGRPVFGVVYAPALRRMYLGDVQNRRAFIGTCSPDEAFSEKAFVALRPEARPKGRLRAVASRSHRSPETDTWLKDHGIADVVSYGSSLKLCALAEGKADVYPRLGRTMEWDIAAGQAVLEATGGQVLVADSDEPLRYGKAEAGFANPPFVAWAAGVEPF